MKPPEAGGLSTPLVRPTSDDVGAIPSFPKAKFKKDMNCRKMGTKITHIKFDE